jgi:DNA (cytosine-5)-methyltransferase 1
MTTYGSLFSGVGGFDLGCDAAGWECKWQVEWDAKARSVLAAHWPDVPKYEDVRDVNGHELAPVDVITYGFPCQDLSVAGKRAGLDGDRSGLFFEATRIIDEMRKATDDAYPRVAVAENVVGLLNADGGAAMGRCVDALADVGALAIEWRVLDAQFFGVPQRRRRVFLVAIFDPAAAGRGQVFPEPESVSGNLEAQRTPGPSLAGSLTKSLGSGGPCDTHALNGWMVPQRTAAITASWSKGPGNTQVDNGCVIAQPIAFGHKQGLSAQASEVHSPTLRANGDGARVYEPELGVRRLTPRECERLMGWPDDHTRYSADGTEIADSSRYRMVGNGVAAPVAKYVAECIEAIL